MSQKSVMALMEEWAEEVSVKSITWHELTILKSFGEWLESRRPSTRAADLSAIELLRKLYVRAVGYNGQLTDQDRDEIAAILKTADGG